MKLTKDLKKKRAQFIVYTRTVKIITSWRTCECELNEIINIVVLYSSESFRMITDVCFENTHCLRTHLSVIHGRGIERDLLKVSLVNQIILGNLK